jgi:hypothetical protein
MVVLFKINLIEIIKRISIRLPRTFYKKILRLTMIYGSECWAVDRDIEQSMSMAEMRMLRRMSGVTREYQKKKLIYKE